MSFNDLPNELLLPVLEGVDSPRDLVSLVRASSRCYAVLRAAPSDRLPTLLVRDGIHPAARLDALAALHAPREEPGKVYDLVPFSDEYFAHKARGTLFPLPDDMGRMMELQRLHDHLSMFMHDYSSRAMRILRGLPPPPPLSLHPAARGGGGRGRGEGEGDAEGEHVLQLSETERGRLQRAFYRWELHCRAAPPFNDDANDTPSQAADDTKDLYIARLQQWEIEELCSVQWYMGTVVRPYVEEFEDGLVAEMLAAAAGPHGTGWGPQSQVEMPFFDAPLDYRNPLRYTPVVGDWRNGPDCILCHMASMGSRFVVKLMAGDADTRRQMLRHKDPVEAVTFASHLLAVPGRTVVGPETGELSRAGPGFHLAEMDPDINPYRYPYFFSRPAHALREKAHAFWDAARFAADPDMATRVLKGPPLRSDLYRKDRKTVETRLNGIRVPAEAAHRVVDRFYEDLHEHSFCFCDGEFTAGY